MAEFEIRFSAAEIAARVDALASEIARLLPKDTLVVAVLKGSLVFTADLIRALSRHSVDWPMDFISLSSYGTGTESTGQVRLTRDISEEVDGRQILLIDDILESGRTLLFAKQMFADRGAGRVWLCTLLDKPTKRRVALEADFVGFKVPDEFVVGYGLDHAHMHRGLPFIAIKK
jgi:hypoxanthine phosphoribosyltransferase